MNKYKYGLKDVPTYILTFDNGVSFTLDTLKDVLEFHGKNKSGFIFHDALWDAALEYAIETASLIKIEKIFIARRVEDGIDEELKKEWNWGACDIDMDYALTGEGDPAVITLTIYKK